jgi:hypothetical protein
MNTGNMSNDEAESIGKFIEQLNNIQPFCKASVTRSNLSKGMCVQDSEGKKGVIRNCEDLHNVHVTFEGEGIEIDWYEIPFECGGSGLYCFVEDCQGNCENEKFINKFFVI